MDGKASPSPCPEVMETPPDSRVEPGASTGARNRRAGGGDPHLRAAHRGVGGRHAHEHRGLIKYDGEPRRAVAYFVVVGYDGISKQIY
ncbi:hypothetical protein ZWY2020_024404 [Hordeum vulgare]|nr:hypothetical protein ZWY2020_024404 [Hordeum vulgare]